MTYPRNIPEVEALARDADYVDSHSVISDKPMRAFIGASLSYMPGWMRFLYKIRAVLVRLMGMKQDEIPHDCTVTADQVSLTPGDKVAFTTVVGGKDESHWIGEASDKHLTGWLVTIAEALTGGQTRYHCVTVVKYRHWTGPVYFNLIRPFHHIVVKTMLRYAAEV